MKRTFKIKAPLLILLLLTIAMCHAQNRKIDSLFKKGSLAIYDHPDQTIKICKHILATSKQDVHNSLTALVMISDAYSSKRDYRKAVEFLIKAQNLSDGLEDNIVKIRILTKTAVQYQQLSIYDKAVKYLDDAHSIIMDYPVKDSIYSFLGTNYTVRGFIYKEQLDCNIAIDYFNRGITEYSKIKTRFKNYNLSIVSYNKANCYVLL